MHRTSSAVPALDNEVLPVGDLPLAPFALTGISEAELARAVIDDRPPAVTGIDMRMFDLGSEALGAEMAGSIPLIPRTRACR
jgi:hypothetical protein